MGKPELWGWLMGLTAVPAIIWILTYGLSVESPRYLLIEQNKPEEAEETLLKLRGTSDVEEELSQMKVEARQAKEQSQEVMSVKELLTTKSVRWQLMSICLMMLCQQLSGKNPRLTDIIEKNGLIGIIKQTWSNRNN